MGEAVISDCGAYRYRLERDIGQQGPVFAFFGVNPSTADASIDDATVRKWRGFTERFGGSRFIVGNVFAYRSTDVRAVARASDPKGPENRYHIRQIIQDADIIVPCWGSTLKVPDRLRADFTVFGIGLTKTGKPVRIFGRTKSGDPLHPLMLPYSTQLQDWNS